MTATRQVQPAPGLERGGKVFEDARLFQAWETDYYHPRARPFYDRLVKRMIEQLGCSPGDAVLDAGCGPGDHSIRAVRAGCRVVALDISETVLEQARAKAAMAGAADRITFMRGDLTRLNVPDESFQAVFSWGVVIHIRDIEAALDELVRVLKPGGRLALYVTNAKAWDHGALQIARRLLGRKAADYERSAMGRGRWHQMSSGALWVWHLDIPAVTRYLEHRGMVRLARQAGAFTELQRRLSGPIRSVMLMFNNIYAALHLPAGPCADNLLIFQKR